MLIYCVPYGIVYVRAIMQVESAVQYLTELSWVQIPVYSWVKQIFRRTLCRWTILK
jgi:hypothetical protein